MTALDLEIIEKDASFLVSMSAYGKYGRKGWADVIDIGAILKRSLGYWGEYSGCLDFMLISPGIIYGVSIRGEGGESEDMTFSTFMGVEVWFL